jgi:single-stranded DNA-binding protein
MTTDAGHKRASFMLAVPYTFTNGKGDKVKKKNYVPVVAWRAVAEQCESARKGYAVQVDGRIMTWSKDEKFHWEIEATLLDILDKTAETSMPQPEAAVA